MAHQQTHVDWTELIALARELPARLADAYAHEREQTHTLHANQQEETVDRLIDLLVSMWTSLAFWYPRGHFNGEDPEAFFRDHLAGRLAWHSLLVHDSTHNPIQALEIKRSVLSDAEDAVADTVAAIFRENDRVMLNLWNHRWSEAKSLRDRFPQ